MTGDPSVKENTTSKQSQKMSQAVIAMELRDSVTKVSLIEEGWGIISTLETPTPHKTTRAAVSEMVRLIIETASAKSRGSHAIAAIGISVPGVVDPPTGRVSIPEIRGWTRVPLVQMLGEGLDESGHDISNPSTVKRARAQQNKSVHPEIFVFPRLASMAAAECAVGSARGKSNVIFLEIDQTIETGILSDGRVVQGGSGFSGAAGWICLSEVFKHGYESAGCLEIEAGKASLPRRAIEEWSGSQNTMLGKLIKSDPQHLDAGTIIRAARGGDPLAIDVVNETCRWIGRSVSTLISMLNPESVIIGGHTGVLLKSFIDQIRSEAGIWSYPPAFKECKISMGSAGENAQLIGAARLALTRKNR